MLETAGLDFSFHRKQWEFHTSKANKILFGGAAGGGKSYATRLSSVIMATEIPGLQIYFFRRKRPDLIRNHMEGRKGFRALLAPWVKAGLVQIIEDEIRFLFNGSRIFLCHCQHEKDKHNYDGAEMDVLIVEELTQFTRAIFDHLCTRVRMANANLPAKYQGRMPRIMCTTNPGNIGHAWVKEMFVDNTPYEIIKEPGEFGMLKQYIPSLPTDNPKLLEEDPGYIERLKAQSNPQMVRAYLLGDWNISQGRFFTKFGKEHQIKSFRVPEYWARFRIFDWGYKDPFNHDWWAVSDGTEFRDDGKIHRYPRGSIILYRNWYGAGPDKKGLELPNFQVANGIKIRQQETEKFIYSQADRAFFAKRGTPCCAETFTDYGLHYSLAKDERVQGWQMVNTMLHGKGDGPLLYIFDNIRDTIRCFENLQTDEKNPEEIADGQEDHNIDTVRYACTSRAYAIDKEVPSTLVVPPLTLASLERYQDDYHELDYEG